MSRPVKKLFDLDIDEVSVVDRAANQHSIIAFSKSVEGDNTPLEGSMPDLAVFEETGEEVDVDTLEHGDVVYDENGNEFVFVEDEADEDDGVEKAGLKEAGEWLGRTSSAAGKKAKGVGRAARRRYTNLGYEGASAGGPARFTRAPNWRNIGVDSAIGGGGAAVVGGGAYAANQKMKKSLGDQVLEELSKAVTEKDREQIIAKMADEVEIAKAAAAEAWQYAEQESDIRIEQEFISKAATYNLPVSPEVLGPILKAMAEVLDESELQVIDDLFNAVGDTLYNEIGYVGESSNSSVIDAVDAYANELVGKSDLTHAQAMVAMLEANPAAYDAYISEKGI